MKKTALAFLGTFVFPLLLNSTEMLGVKDLKSPTKGVLLSVGSTVIPVGIGCLIYSIAESNNNNAFTWCGGLLAVSGAVIGPDVGHFYAQQWALGRERAGIRFTVGLAFGLSMGYVIASAGAAGLGGETSQTEYKIAMGTMIVSGCAYLVYTIYDIATVPASVHKYNKSLSKSNKMHIIPRFDVIGQKYGLSVVCNFK
jgi:hypothetical protein